MNNKLTFQWGVVPGREVGTITKRFHKKREGSQAEREVARAHAIPLKEARRLLRYAQASNARKDSEKKSGDYVKLEVARQRKLVTAAVKAQSSEHDRAARVAAYMDTLEK